MGSASQIKGKMLRAWIETAPFSHSSDECLLWPGSTDRRGYGQLQRDGRKRRAQISKIQLRQCFVNVVVCIALSGCATFQPDTSGALLFCDAATPFAWSTRDTDYTIRQAKALNAIGVAACGWRGNAK